MRLLAIDGNSIVNRAFYGVRLLQNKKGQYTNAIFGFLNILMKLEKDYPADCVAIAFDLKAPTFRHQQYADYKGTRKGMPEELAEQMAPLKQLLEALGYPMFSLEGYEADDILGTLARYGEANGMETVIATGDRDALQLVSEKTAVCLVKTKEQVYYTPDVFQAEYGLDPIRLIDLKALMGDASDNIPGVKGIGEKTALKLIQHAGSLENLLADIDAADATPRIKKLLTEGREAAKISQTLATIFTEVPIPLDKTTIKQKERNEEVVATLLTDLELFSFFNRLSVDRGAVVEKEEETVKEVPVATLLQNPPKEEVLSRIQKEGRLDLVWQDGLYLCFADIVYFFDGLLAEMFLDEVLALKVPKRLYEAKSLYRRLFSKGKTMEGVTLDVTIAAYLLNVSAKGYALDQLVQKHLPYQTTETPELLFTALCDALEKEVAEQEMTDLLQQVELPLCEVLAAMEEEGFAVDGDALVSYGEGLSDRIDTLRAQLLTLAEEEFNPNSTKELSRILFEKLGLPPKKKTKSGFSTDAEVLEQLRGEHPIIETLLEYRKLSKLHSTYVVGLQKVITADGRVHSTFNQTETRTGRISSTEPNVQNIPVRTTEGEKLRAFFVAKPGYTLVDADYSQIELRILAAIADDENMKQAFHDGVDIHRMTASQVLHVPFEEVTAKQRSSAKAINFGIVYGISAYSLSEDIHVSVYEAKQYIEDYLSTYRGVRQYMDDIVAFAKEHRYVKTLYHRRRDLSDINNANKRIQALSQRIAFNTPIQGTAADIIKIAMIRVYKRLQQEQLDAKLILQVHDELIIEAKTELAEQVATLLQEEMQAAATLSVPLVVDVATGQNWLQAKG